MESAKPKPAYPTGECAGLGPSGLGAQKIPKNESEHGEDDHQDCPKDLLSRICAALKDIDDGPDIEYQNNKTAQALVLHVSIILIGIAKPLRYTFVNPWRTENRKPAFSIFQTAPAAPQF
jgi:hypothetical protein